MILNNNANPNQLRTIYREKASLFLLSMGKEATEYDGNKKDINTIEIANSLILGSHCTINKNNLYNNKDNKSNAGISILQNRKDASMSTNSNELEDQEEEMSRLEKYRNQLWKNSSAARTIISANNDTGDNFKPKKTTATTCVVKIKEEIQ
uniref:Uncharacterized protein n=1 Tax=Eucampia antarctica TaxID=49252 RepID=A0A7S2R2H9_9STRA|mmetsp:Transcript_14846/g.14304  ORF Transcript_14846/g.14304 Transcript_14846/m.14304 type:complete len:151 (+) Transcript_14846:94-546(+)